MAKFTDLQNPHQGVINPWSLEAIQEQLMTMGGANMAQSTSLVNWPSGSLGVFIPFFLNTHMYVQSMLWVNGATVAGFVDAGIFTQDGQLIASFGPKLQSGTSVVQMDVFSPPVHLWGGLYYMGMSMSNTTGIVAASSNQLPTGTFAQLLGMAQAPNVVPLPPAPTLGTVGQDFIPVLSISSDAGI